MKEITKKLIKEVNRLIKKKRKGKKIIQVQDNQNKIQEYTKYYLIINIAGLKLNCWDIDAQS